MDGHKPGTGSESYGLWSGLPLPGVECRFPYRYIRNKADHKALLILIFIMNLIMK
jgi:hypothetical protein